MKIFANKSIEEEQNSRLHLIKEPKSPARPLPPHDRRELVRIEYDEQDWGLMRDIFGDEDTAAAAAAVISGAPPEIQILAVQLINALKEV